MSEHRPSPEQLIDLLNLTPLAGEGGMYCQSYFSADAIPSSGLPERYAQQPRPFGTAIFYLLTSRPNSFSALHRLPTDEIYHFYLGDPLELTLLYPDGTNQQVILGPDVLNGQQVQYTVTRGVWQGSRVAPGGQYALVGTTMAPGFIPVDFEGGDRAVLLEKYPDARKQIMALTR